LTVVRDGTELPRPVVALAGNPNTGKSTLFNALTGLKQHTGNWPGKTVACARGWYRYNGQTVTLVDLPGTYSLLSDSPEERITRDFLCFGRPDATVVVVDATCLERNLHLIFQIMEIGTRVVACLNLMDEARRRGIRIDVPALARELGVPVVPVAARRGEGLTLLKETLHRVIEGTIRPAPRPVSYDPELEAAVAELATDLAVLSREGLNPRWVALCLIAGDESIIPKIRTFWNGKETQGKTHVRNRVTL
jgi:Fe2+ transport system protein B